MELRLRIRVKSNLRPMANFRCTTMILQEAVCRQLDFKCSKDCNQAKIKRGDCYCKKTSRNILMSMWITKEEKVKQVKPYTQEAFSWELIFNTSFFKLQNWTFHTLELWILNNEFWILKSFDNHSVWLNFFRSEWFGLYR